jgi:ArsR family transcriptional regulator
MDYNAQADLFSAMAHPVRLHILDLLCEGEVCVCHLEAALGRRQAYLSQQLMVLRQTGLVETRKDGLRVYYRLARPEIAAMLRLFRPPAESTERIADCRCPSCAATPAPMP